MGGKGSKAKAVGSPANGPVNVLGQQYVLSERSALKMKQKFWSSWGNGDYQVKDLDDKVWFVCDQKFWDLNNERSLLDGNGEVVCTALEKLASVRSTWHIYQNGFRKATIAKKILSTKSWGEVYMVYVWDTPDTLDKFTKDSDTELDPYQPTLCVRTSFTGWGIEMFTLEAGKTEPTKDSVPWARTQETLSWRDVVLDAETYLLEVAPNVDIAFANMLTMIVAKDLD
ncbi:hypothetical protein CYMTET_39309 [Cymbomonas tetramitiformis]|uniref:Uncharacterized protein n=1 Tax=Cymbomonas tetramitiformis TaxID=36881 RepID=A0AAE0F4D4_9CHLO|nr:hypothetical protein CYMTET_39309 [Cymbomonas tetramitiformis]